MKFRILPDRCSCRRWWPSSRFATHLRRALVPGLFGMAAGVGVSLWWTPALQALLFELESNDVVTFAATCALVAAIVLLASLLPAWRLSRVDPVIVLRFE